MAITIVLQPAPIQPVFNQILTTFTSTNVALTGFRYLVDVYSGNSTTVISRLKIVPQIDGSGKADISRILANYVSVDFEQFTNVVDPATNSFFNYSIKVGEEYQTPAWNFTRALPFTSSTTSLVYTRLSGTTATPYVVNDQILISVTATTNPLYGLHKVLQASGNTTVVNVLYTGATTGTTISGATVYADGRKSAFSGLTSLSSLTVFNGVRSFAEYLNYSSNVVNVGTPNTIRMMLTDLPFSGFSASEFQIIHFNTMVTKTAPYQYNLYVVSNDGQSAATQTVNANALREVVQFPFSFADTNFNLTGVTYVDVFLTRSNLGVQEQLTKKYRINLDKRCTINDYEISFMDRMGSIGSFKFQLRKKETGTIERIQYKQQVPDNYNTTDKGTTNVWVGVQKELELNTDWMSEEMNIYFEQLLSSPYTWIKVDENSFSYACVITDVAFEIEFQKNKKLIRKTIKVRYANQDAVNI